MCSSMATIDIASQRIDYLDEKVLDERLSYIAAIHHCLENDFPHLIDMYSQHDLRGPHDISRPRLFTYRQILNQVRYWSTFLSLPMKRLRRIHKDLTDEDPEERDAMFHTVMIGLSVVPEMIWMYTRIPADMKEVEALRNSTAADMVRERDGAVCCITGKIKVECCHIFPFWTKGREMGGVVDDEGSREIEHGIEIRFHWLPATSLEHLKVENPHPCTKDPRRLVVPIPGEYSETFQGSSRPLVTGHTFTIWANKLEDLPSMEFLNLRWLAFKIHRLAGGADLRIYEPPFPDEDNMNVVYEEIEKAQEVRDLEQRLLELKARQS
ncbi:hypothetical protein CcaCcLH18_04690 [Colletotrichum camelliae]|nr:hypothetical protein CcaCcLH18_04690 [Colletotrichum camelliae]